MYARDATTISPYALLLFGGALRVEHAARRIVVDDWLSIDASPRTAVLVKQVRPRPHRAGSATHTREDLHTREEQYTGGEQCIRKNGHTGKGQDSKEDQHTMENHTGGPRHDCPP